MNHTPKDVARALEIVLSSLKFDRETTRILKLQLDSTRRLAQAVPAPDPLIDPTSFRADCTGFLNWIDVLVAQIEATSCDPDDPDAFDETLLAVQMWGQRLRGHLEQAGEAS